MICTSLEALWHSSSALKNSPFLTASSRTQGHSREPLLLSLPEAQPKPLPQTRWVTAHMFMMLYACITIALMLFKLLVITSNLLSRSSWNTKTHWGSTEPEDAENSVCLWHSRDTQGSSQLLCWHTQLRAPSACTSSPKSLFPAASQRKH